MNIFKVDKQPNEVFNPRGEYNPEMYIARPEYERSFRMALHSDLCILVHGQSGTGKTWLTRRVLTGQFLEYRVVNLATASTAGSINSCLKSIMSSEGWEIRTGRTERMSASANAGIANGKLETEKKFENYIDYFMEFLKFFSYRANHKNKKRYIIFENMEAILADDNLIKELANIITLVDDERVLKYKTKFIIIGATKDIHQYFRKVLNVNTIDNRVYELEDIGTLTTTQARQLVRQGFEKLQLQFSSDEVKRDCIEEYVRITGGLPQRLHELCLIFSELCREYDQVVESALVKEGIARWIRTSLHKNYVFTARLLDNDGKENSFKNKVLYCLTQKDALYFTKEEIDAELVEDFPASTGEKLTLATTTRILNELCKCEPPLLCSSEDTFGQYAFVDFKCALCLRAILSKDGERVYKNDAYDIYL